MIDDFNFDVREISNEIFIIDESMVYKTNYRIMIHLISNIGYNISHTQIT